MEYQALECIELDINICQLLYGTTNGAGTCSAALGATGSAKCFNTRATCQVLGDYNPGIVTLRFAKDTEYWPRDIPIVASSLVDVKYSPTTISLGKSLGERAQLTATFADHPWGDRGAGFDKYVDERGYDAAAQGWFFSKLRARHISLRGCAFRWINGWVGQALEEMETRHFIVDSNDGPGRERLFSIIAKDVLKLAAGDRAMTPPVSNGFLLTGITNSQTSATLAPSGIGDEEYPASGLVQIGGNEICAFTRAGNTLTLTRGQLGTSAAAHDAQDRVQLVRSYVSKTPSYILSDVFQTDAGIDASYTPTAEWETEETSFLNRTYTRYIAEPTQTDTIVSELVEQACLSVYPDDLAKKIRMRVLRGIPPDVTVFSPDNIVAGTFVSRDQPEKRLSQVVTRYGMRHPLLPAEQASSYRSQRGYKDYDLEQLYGSAAVREISGTWIPAFASSAADRLNSLLVSRFANPPRNFKFSISRVGPVQVTLGMAARLMWPGVTDDTTGAPSTTPIQVVRVKPAGRRIEVEAEEMLAKVLTDEDLLNRQIVIDFNTNNINLRSLHDTSFPVPTGEEGEAFNVICTIAPDVVVGSTSVSLPAFEVGDWPAGVSVKLGVLGWILGKGGNAGAGGAKFNVNGGDGQAGGTALRTRKDVEVELGATGKIAGGGGGGAGGGGCGGAPVGNGSNYLVGSGGGGGAGAGEANGTPGSPGGGAATRQTGGAAGAGKVWSGSLYGGNGGRGGDLGQPGGNGGAGRTPYPYGDRAGGTGGAAGKAIDGVSYCDFTQNDGVRLGPEVN